MKKTPVSVWSLSVLLALQSLGALYGGLALVMSPSGEFFQMPLSMLEGSPFSSFLVPGLILLVLVLFHLSGYHAGGRIGYSGGCTDTCNHEIFRLANPQYWYDLNLR